MLLPLLRGLGNSAQQPELFSIGDYRGSVVSVGYDVFWLWQWTHLDPNLWEGCCTFARAARAAGRTDEASLDPHQVLAQCLQTLHTLLASGAAYLDIVLVDSEPTRLSTLTQRAAAMS